jgi:hypothetical protein
MSFHTATLPNHKRLEWRYQEDDETSSLAVIEPKHEAEQADAAFPFALLGTNGSAFGINVGLKVLPNTMSCCLVDWNLLANAMSLPMESKK